MWSVALRPRWIAALLLALAIAAAFAALGQWQLERSFASGDIVTRETETVVPLESISQPQQPVAAAADGQLVTVGGTFRADDYVVLSERLNGGVSGYWVVGRLVTTGHAAGDASLLVARGWSETEAQAASVVEELSTHASETVTVTGRYLAGEGPQETDFQGGQLHSLAPATMINLWDDLDDGGVFGGFVVADEAPAGLDAIDSLTPSEATEVNWLNIFYALEWVVFAGFAIFLWWRLVKDAWEAEQEERAPLPEVN